MLCRNYDLFLNEPDFVYVRAKMKAKTFNRLFYILIAIGLIVTVAHTVYALYAYDNSSIIYFVSKELW